MPETGTPIYRSERVSLRQPSEPARDGSVIQPAVDQKPPEPSPWLARSLARAQARGRLETEMRALAVDLLGRCQPGELPTDCTAWLAAAIEAAVKPVCDASLAALAKTLDAQLAAAPPGVLQRLQAAEARHDAGCF